MYLPVLRTLIKQVTYCENGLIFNYLLFIIIEAIYAYKLRANGYLSLKSVLFSTYCSYFWIF